MSGKINTPLQHKRAKVHVDSRSSLHHDDFKRARAKTAEARILRIERLVNSTNRTLQHPSLGRGICFDADWRELAFDEHQSLLDELSRGSNTYTAPRADRPGKMRSRKASKGGLKLTAITFRPDHAIALSALEGGAHAHRIKPLMILVCKIAVEEFEAFTGLKVEAIQIHPIEGVLHIHLAYRTVVDGKLLLATGTPGWHGVHGLRQGVLGTLRQIGAGVRSSVGCEWAYDEYNQACGQCGGDFPPNHEIAQSVDATIELFASEPAIRPYFFSAYLKWQEDVARKIEIENAADKEELCIRQAQKIAALHDQLHIQEYRREQAQIEIEWLKVEVARLSERKPAISTPTTKMGNGMG